jgi:hypothetical protein
MPPTRVAVMAMGRGPRAQAWVVGLLADVLHADRVEGDHDPVIDIDRGDVAYHVGEMLGGDVGTDGVGVGILDGRRLALGHEPALGNPSAEDASSEETLSRAAQRCNPYNPLVQPLLGGINEVRHDMDQPTGRLWQGQ